MAAGPGVPDRAWPRRSTSSSTGGVLVTGTTDPRLGADFSEARLGHRPRTTADGRPMRPSSAGSLALPAIVGCRETRPMCSMTSRRLRSAAARGAREGYVYGGHRRLRGGGDRPLATCRRRRPRSCSTWPIPRRPRAGGSCPPDGVGLARMEFVINHAIKVHPLALTRFDTLTDEAVKEEIETADAGLCGRSRISSSIRWLTGSPGSPRCITRTRSSCGCRISRRTNMPRFWAGRASSRTEENPMIGWRGASRYYSEGYKDGFALECRAIRQVRETRGVPTT